MISAIVLAAGTGSRFGGTKQVASVGGRPLVRHAVDAARGAGIEDVVVVVGHDAETVTAALAMDARIVPNPRFAEGMATSLVAGIEALGDDVDAAVVLLADQPGITGAHLRALLEAAEHRDQPIVRLVFADAPGPALLRRSVWEDLRTLEGDVGARALAERRPDLVFEARLDQPAPLDVDTPADLERARLDPRHDPGHEEPPSL